MSLPMLPCLRAATLTGSFCRTFAVEWREKEEGRGEEEERGGERVRKSEEREKRRGERRERREMERGMRQGSSKRTQANSSTYMQHILYEYI